MGIEKRMERLRMMWIMEKSYLTSDQALTLLWSEFDLENT